MPAHFCHLIFQLWVVWCELRKKRKLRNCWHGMKLGWPSYLFGKPTIKAQVCNNLWLLTKITKQCYQKNPFFFMSQKNCTLHLTEFFWHDFSWNIIRIVFEKSSYPVLGFCHLTYFLLIKENAFFLVALLRESSCRLKFRALSNCEFLIRSEAAKAQWDQSFSGVAFALWFTDHIAKGL